MIANQSFTEDFEVLKGLVRTAKRIIKHSSVETDTIRALKENVNQYEKLIEKFG